MIPLICVTVLLLPVFFFSAKNGFEGLYQYYLAKVALTEFEARTRKAEDRAKEASVQVDVLLRRYDPMQKEITDLRAQLENIQSIINLKQITVSRNPIIPLR